MFSRHFLRLVVVQTLYEWDFWKNERNLTEIVERNIQRSAFSSLEKEFVKKLIGKVQKNREGIDEIIVKTAPQWPLDQISILDRNILRIGLAEMLYSDREDVPEKVAIDEAVELGKEFGGPTSGKFINGVLGTVYEHLHEILKDKK